MNRTALILATGCALLVGLVASWSHAADQTPSGGQEVQANDVGARRTNEPPKTRDLTVVRQVANPQPRPLRGARAPGVAHALVPKSPAGTAARGYLVRKPNPDHPTGVSGFPAAARGISGASPPSNSAARSAVSSRPLAGNAVIGGPHLAGRRTVIKAGVDGTAFHHRS